MEELERRQLLNDIKELVNKGYSYNGVSLVSGANTIEGDFFGFSIGSTKPTTMVITKSKANIKLNGAALAITDDLINFASEGEFVPMEFTKMTITGTGYVKCYNK